MNVDKATDLIEEFEHNYRMAWPVTYQDLVLIVKLIQKLEEERESH